MSQPRPKRGDVHIPLAALIVEDSESDTQLIVRLLKNAGYDVIFERVATAEQMRSALEKRIWDIVISDYSLPQFDGRAALELLKEKQPDIPFLIVSGAIGEEIAVAMMKAGAHDYLIKNNLAHLAQAVARELEQAQSQRERKQAEIALKESESFNQALLKNSPIGISVRGRTGQLLSANDAWKKIWALSESELQEDLTRDRPTLTFEERYDFLASHWDDVRRVYEQGGHLYLPELKTVNPRPGAAEWISKYYYAILDAQGQVVRVVVLTEDITERKLAHEVIQESEERLAAVMEGSQLGYSDWNIQTGEIRRNERWAGMLGYSLKEIESNYQQWEDLIHPNDLADARQAIQDHLNGKIPIHRDEYRLRTKDGSYRWILDQGKIVEYDLQGRPLRMTATHTDITELKQAEDQLRQLSSAVEHSPAAIMITDRDGKIEYVNPKFSAVNGYTLGEVVGKTPRILKSDKTPPEVYVELWQTILSGKEWRGEFLNRRKNGQLYWEFASISAIVDSKGNITHFVSVNEDITARKESEEKIKRLNAGLEQLAMTDYLTSLYNRRYFMQRGAEEFKRTRRNKQTLALLMLDIDEFKKVNDTYGHEAGDMALQQAAAVLKASLRETDILGRIGGEEFAVLLPNTLLEEAVILAERVREILANTSFETLGEALTITITICIGVAAYTEGMSNIDELLRHADMALYNAKHSGRNRVMKYENTSGEFLDLPSGSNGE
jgi:diguanylate cyclase (GGDEF)-like protein/PAS domain S-box-containing protein